MEFLQPAEYELGKRFLKDGYLIVEVEDKDSLGWMREKVAVASASLLKIKSGEADLLLNKIHEHISKLNLNDLRLNVIEKLNADRLLRPRYYSLAREALWALVGNELAMQLRINLSIQLPGDDSSLLPVHADVWSGDSPFEVVMWVPLVDCYKSKSMFILPPGPTQVLHDRFAEYKGRSNEDIYQDIKRDLEWVEVKYGQALLFNQNLPHGNRVNMEKETRWSMNCRFKSVFSPYSDKKLGEFFEPITIRPATRIGMHYRYPDTGD